MRPRLRPRFRPERRMSMDGALLWLEQRSRDLERLLGELVEISSHTEDRAGVSRVAARFVDAARDLGRGALSGAPVPSASGRYGDHLRLETAARGPAIVLIGHHDTVFPQPSFAGFREDGPLLRGPGVLDMKGGLA